MRLNLTKKHYSKLSRQFLGIIMPLMLPPLLLPVLPPDLRPLISSPCTYPKYHLVEAKDVLFLWLINDLMEHKNAKGESMKQLPLFSALALALRLLQP